MKDVIIASAVRTAVGKAPRGMLRTTRPDDLAAFAINGALDQVPKLDKSEIESREKSPNSVMPEGLLDKLTREEILDLVAYVVSRGDQRHAMFQGGHEHGHGAGH